MPYLGDLGRTRRYDTPGLRAEPAVVWQDAAMPAPLSLVAVLPDRVVAGGPDGLVRCLDLGDGRERWPYDAAGPVVTAGDAADSRIVLATNRVYDELSFVRDVGYWTDGAPFSDGLLHARAGGGGVRPRHEAVRVRAELRRPPRPWWPAGQ